MKLKYGDAGHHSQTGDSRQRGPGTYLPDIAMTLNNLGNLNSTQSRIEEARKAYKEALAIRRTLAASNPDIYLPDLAMTIIDFGVLHRTANRMEEERKGE